MRLSDYVIFVMKATAPGTASEAKLRDLLKHYSTPGILVLSYWDQVDDDRQTEVMAYAQEFAAAAFPDKKTQVYCIDGKTAEKAVRAGVQIDEPGCRHLQSFISEKLADKNVQLAKQLAGFASQAAWALEAHLKHLRSQRKNATGEHEKHTTELKQEVDRICEDLKESRQQRQWLQEEERAARTEEEMNLKDDEKHLREKEENADKGGVFEGAVSRGSQAASAGAAMGTVIPALGTAVGAVVGGLTGALAGAWEGQFDQKAARERRDSERQRYEDRRNRYKKSAEKRQERLDDLQRREGKKAEDLSHVREQQQQARDKLTNTLGPLTKDENSSKKVLRTVQQWQAKWHPLL